VPVRGGLAVVPDVDRVGLYQVTWKGPQAGTLVVPVNLVSEPESDLRARPLPPAQAGAGGIEVHAAAERADAHSEWTWVLALVALGLIVFDVWYATRDPRARSPVADPAGAARPRAPERKTA
jgi:hypothetical protein